jgi:hypothetical protein
MSSNNSTLNGCNSLMPGERILLPGVQQKHRCSDSYMTPEAVHSNDNSWQWLQ